MAINSTGSICDWPALIVNSWATPTRPKKAKTVNPIEGLGLSHSRFPLEHRIRNFRPGT
jgi:hypothetical protein